MSGAARAFVALGSNLGDRRGNLEGALAALGATPGVRIAAVSAAFQNPPVGGPPQGPYWNAVVEVATTLSPRPFHRLLREIEDAGGRVRGDPDGPRTLDLDLLVHGETLSGEPDLRLPHPRALDRAFVLGPWSEIAPEAVVPGTGRTVLAHAARLRAAQPGAFEALERAALLAPRPAGAAHRRPEVLPDRAALSAWRRRASGDVGFVPTMGALHEGHATLARRARAACDVVLASLFVNPLQFGPNEDYTRYPRTFEADLALLGAEGVDAVYAPAPEDLYPPGFSTSIDVLGPSEGYEGAARPGHFRGVATVVAKLLRRAGARRAWFGRKDAQQVAVIRRLVRDLDLDVEIVVAPTVRDVDGLALSSRNRYLEASDRTRALGLPRALDAARRAAALGERDGGRLEAIARGLLEADPVRAVSYVALVEPDGFARVPRLGDAPALLVAAVKVGTTRLLDNEWMVVGTATGDEDGARR